MNREAIAQLREHIAKTPDEGFRYSSFWEGDGQRVRQWWRGEIPSCGTVGCVAGHACILFRIRALDPRTGFRRYVLPADAAGSFLELSEADQETLFYLACTMASRQDAVRRLDYLLEHGTLAGYHVRGESWWVSGTLMTPEFQAAAPHRPLPPPTDPEDSSPGKPSQTMPVPAPRRAGSNTGEYVFHETRPQSGQPAESLSSES